MEYVGSVTLILLGDDLEPDWVSAEMKLEPSQCWRKGERKSMKSKDGGIRLFDSKHEWGGWKSFVPPSHRGDPIESQLEFWVGLLRSRTPSLKRLRLLGFQCILDVFVTSGETATVVIPHQLQKSVAALGVDLHLSFWASHESEQAAPGDALNARA